MADIATANVSAKKAYRGGNSSGMIWKVISDGSGVTVPLYGATSYPYVIGSYTSAARSGDTVTVTLPAGTNLSIRNFLLIGP